MSFLAWSPTPKPKATVSLKVLPRLPASAKKPSVNFFGPLTFSKGTVSGVSGRFRLGSSHGATGLVAGEDSLSMELGARFGLLKQVVANQAACTEHVAQWRLDIKSRFGRHTRLPLQRQWPGRNGLARLLLPVGSHVWSHVGESTAQTARTARCWLRRGQCWPSVSRWKACGVSCDTSCSLDGDLEDAKEGIVWRRKLFLSWSNFVLLAPV